LKEGEQVVVDGQYKLQPGAPVQIITPNKAANGKPLTQAEETPAANQATSGKISPDRTAPEHHRRLPQASEKPAGSAPPAMANQG
jgi:hypothetical protein